MIKISLLMLTTVVVLVSGSLERNWEIDPNGKIFNINQNGVHVGYATLGFDGGENIISVINITGSRKYVKVKCENSSSAKNVNSGNIVKKSFGLVASNAEKFKLRTKGLLSCGPGAIEIVFK